MNIINIPDMEWDLGENLTYNNVENPSMVSKISHINYTLKFS